MSMSMSALTTQMHHLFARERKRNLYAFAVLFVYGCKHMQASISNCLNGTNELRMTQILKRKFINKALIAPATTAQQHNNNCHNNKKHLIE